MSAEYLRSIKHIPHRDQWVGHPYYHAVETFYHQIPVLTDENSDPSQFVMRHIIVPDMTAVLTNWSVWVARNQNGDTYHLSSTEQEETRALRMLGSAICDLNRIKVDFQPTDFLVRRTENQASQRQEIQIWENYAFAKRVGMSGKYTISHGSWGPDYPADPFGRDVILATFNTIHP